MKKIFLVAVVLLMASTLVFGAPRAKRGAAAPAATGGNPFVVDLSTLSAAKMADAKYAGGTIGNFTKNQTPFAKGWDDFMMLIPESSLPSNLSAYQRLTVTCKYYKADGEEIPQSDSIAMVVVIYDPAGDIRGPAMGPGPNTPVKEMNVGGFSGMIHKDRGIRVTFAKAPGAIMFQNNPGTPCAFIELTSMVFHNGDYKSE
ncbi:MAG: hypothetical protein FWB95_06705 [Treponema sp.]|nr:hypothetical protein [Treponema sp.]